MAWIKADTLQTRAEEIGNATTHGLGILLSLVAIVLLVLFSSNQDDVLKVVSGIVFGSSLLLMYVSSTIYLNILFQKNLG